MALTYVLNVIGENQDLELYINSRDEIYIGESYNKDDPYHNSIVLPIKDWEEIKNHIDKLISENENK